MESGVHLRRRTRRGQGGSLKHPVPKSCYRRQQPKALYGVADERKQPHLEGSRPITGTSMMDIDVNA